MNDEPFVVVGRQLRPIIGLPSKADAVAFLDQEAKLWSWIDNSIEPNAPLNGVLGRYRPENWVQQFRNFLNEKTKTSFVQAMQQRYGADQCISSIDTEARAISLLSETDKTVAAAALATVHGESLVLDRNFMRDIRHRIGFAHGSTILAGLDPSIASGSARALSEARGDFELETQRLRALLEETRKTASKSAKETSEAAHALGVAHEAKFSTAQSERNEAFSRLRDELEAITKAYEVRMELQ